MAGVRAARRGWGSEGAAPEGRGSCIVAGKGGIPWTRSNPTWWKRPIAKRWNAFGSRSAKNSELVEAMFRKALEEERTQKEKDRDLVEEVHREAVEYARQNPPPVEPPRGVHYTELPEAKPGEALAEEWNTDRREVGPWLAEGQEGQHVLIKGEEIIGIFATFDAAYEAGVKRYWRQTFFVHPIVPKSRTFVFVE